MIDKNNRSRDGQVFHAVSMGSSDTADERILTVVSALPECSGLRASCVDKNCAVCQNDGHVEHGETAKGQESRKGGRWFNKHDGFSSVHSRSADSENVRKMPSPAIPLPRLGTEMNREPGLSKRGSLPRRPSIYQYPVVLAKL